MFFACEHCEAALPDFFFAKLNLAKKFKEQTIVYVIFFFCCIGIAK